MVSVARFPTSPSLLPCSSERVNVSVFLCNGLEYVSLQFRSIAHLFWSDLSIIQCNGVSESVCASQVSSTSRKIVENKLPSTVSNLIVTRNVWCVVCLHCVHSLQFTRSIVSVQTIDKLIQWKCHLHSLGSSHFQWNIIIVWRTLFSSFFILTPQHWHNVHCSRDHRHDVIGAVPSAFLWSSDLPRAAIMFSMINLNARIIKKKCSRLMSTSNDTAMMWCDARVKNMKRLVAGGGLWVFPSLLAKSVVLINRIASPASSDTLVLFNPMRLWFSALSLPLACSRFAPRKFS